MIKLIPGRVYNRRGELHAVYGGQQQGGISTPKDHPVVFLFTGDQGAAYGYHDGFQGDGVFWYTGEGQVGDMQMLRGNRAICHHRQTGRSLHLFLYVPQGVQYVGEATYLSHRENVAPDREGNPRRAIVFELAVLEGELGAPDITPDETPAEPGTLWALPLNVLRDQAYQVEWRHLPSVEQKRLVHYRSSLIKVYVLRRAGGVCEGCGANAPFVTRKGNPYLEPHHLRRRADGGPDHPHWVLALCPNCHARVHHAADGSEYNAQLAKRVLQIESKCQHGDNISMVIK